MDNIGDYDGARDVDLEELYCNVDKYILPTTSDYDDANNKDNYTRVSSELDAPFSRAGDGFTLTNYNCVGLSL